MSTVVTERVAELVRNPSAPLRDTRNAQAARSQPRPAPESDSRPASSADNTADNTAEYSVGSDGDRLSLSPLAQKILETDRRGGGASHSEWEERRAERVERTQQLVRQNQYKISPAAADSIAQRIVALLP
jgi:hypothetical protein